MPHRYGKLDLLEVGVNVLDPDECEAVPDAGMVPHVALQTLAEQLEVVAIQNGDVRHSVKEDNGRRRTVAVDDATGRDAGVVDGAHFIGASVSQRRRKEIDVCHEEKALRQYEVRSALDCLL